MRVPFRPFISGNKCYDKDALGVMCPGVSLKFSLDKDRWCYRCSCYASFMKPKVEKPPIGIMPCKLHRQERMEIIIDAMQRYTKANIQIPKEWIEELNTINKRIY